MARFNETPKVQYDMTRNFGDYPAYRLSLKERLVTSVLNSFFKTEKHFYGDVSTQLVTDAREMLQTDPVFVAKLAVFAREEFYLRSVSHVLFGELAHSIKGEEYVKNAIARGILRADDMTEVLAYYLKQYGKPVPNSLKKGLGLAFGKFDEYQLAKYNRDNAIKLRDILRLTHPIPVSDGQEILWGKVLSDTLQVPYTWETELSAKGNKKEVWEDLIDSRRLGYMAMLRNLRNVVNAGVSQTHFDAVCSFIANERAVANSMQLPFRFVKAYEEVEKLYGSKLPLGMLLDAIETAARIAATKNIEQFKGTTLIAGDVSGSMKSEYIDDKRTTSAAEICTLFLAMANLICERAHVVTFDTGLYTQNISKYNSIIKTAKEMRVNGGGTDVSLPMQYIIDNNIKVDRIIMISDNEINRGWDNATRGYFYGRNKTACQALLDIYKQRVNPRVFTHTVDLTGYGTAQFAGQRVNRMAGFSEKIFQYMHLFEAGTGSLISQIEKISL